MAPSSLFHHFLPPLLLLLALISPSDAQAYHNISLGSSLTPLGENSSWLSPSGEFAFGFYPLETDSSLFLLAIWFVKTANKTVVWYANGDKLVQDGAVVQLTTDGDLSLKDHNGQNVWDADISNASYAAMLDTGNFVLASADATVSWQSFALPSDTILPSQELNLDTELRARMMDTDYSSGRFKLRVQADGNLVFYSVAVPFEFQYDPYWASNTVGNGTQLVFDELGTIYLDLKNGTRLNFTSARIASMGDFYHRATLDSDGVFRQYVYPKNGMRDGSWNEGWNLVDFQPPDICQAVTTGTGSGACGFNSYCKSGNQSLVDCECPPGYSFLDPNRKYKGCEANFPAQRCDADEKEIESLYGFSVKIDVNWPFSDYEHFNPVDEDRCRKECLSDCFCAVAIYNNGNCWKKKLPLANGKTVPSNGSKALIKVAKGNNSQPPPPTPIIVKKDRGARILVGSLLLGSSAVVNFVLITAILFVRSCSYNKVRRKLQPGSNMAALSLRSFTYSELEEATNGFSEELGSGAFSRVYKGYFDDGPTTCVAVKKLDNLLPDMDKEFMNEVGSIGRTYHKNLVRLHGFCNEGNERLLVYEFMKNGSLREFLFGSVRPNWNLRVQIALGIARGLLYLHEECSNQIIHCDIKPQNILLDDNLVARISDFGLAKLLRTDQTRTNTAIRGTRGYVAPEWFKNIGITAKVDVYSFGVMLLEIVCCRKCVEQEVGNEEGLILTYWVSDCYRDGMLELVVEGDEEAAFDMKRVERFVKVALWCIQEEPSMRPTMQKVTQMLDGATSIPEPPDPSSYMSSIQ
ncbi:G-type lectin S-receptor-like serine/threonine-protein kinase LECRK3 [Phoenix dactylifera]|uniref:Receptor-like serine/threonine-protein kinase n=1 Tax=Phoenix dactylifera TaxID=42345 RepID=A0A8B7CWI6_PHODC|nr:G-type lectin S-receptor-like serine/threonine-protein kinase LECRK3 [Phoenix dactylifera]